MSEPLAVVSVSGGKDSTATALLAMDRMGRENCRFVFSYLSKEISMVKPKPKQKKTSPPKPVGWLMTRICDTCGVSFVGSDPRFCPVCHAKAHAGSPLGESPQEKS